MPIFEYKCNECNNQFEELVANSEQKIICPECESENVNKLLSVFSATGTSSVSSTPCGQSSCNSGFS